MAVLQRLIKPQTRYRARPFHARFFRPEVADHLHFGREYRDEFYDTRILYVWTSLAGKESFHSSRHSSVDEPVLIPCRDTATMLITTSWPFIAYFTEAGSS